MVSVDVELALVGLTAVLEPATLLSSTLALVISKRPLQTGALFYIGGWGVTLFIGVVAAFALGNKTASRTSTPKTWVSIVTILAGAAILVYAIRLVFRPADAAQAARLTERVDKVTSASAPAIILAGAALANPGVFMLVAAKSISQLDPSTAQYVLDWVLFTSRAASARDRAADAARRAPIHPTAPHRRPRVDPTTRSKNHRGRPPRTGHISSPRRHCWSHGLANIGD